MGLSRSLIAVSILCVFASTPLAPASAQTARDGATESHGAGNTLQFVPGILNAISDAKKRKEARRKAAAERAKEEQQQEQQPVDDAASTPAVPAVVERPIFHPRPMRRPKPRPHRPTPVTQPLLTPTPAPATPPPVITQPSLALAPTTAAKPSTVTPRPPALHVQAASPMPKIVVPAGEPDRWWLLIFLVVAGAGAVGAAGYVFREALGFVPPPPAARAFADIGTSSAPVFEKDGPQISFMIGLPAFTTTSDYPEQTK